MDIIMNIHTIDGEIITILNEEDMLLTTTERSNFDCIPNSVILVNLNKAYNLPITIIHTGKDVEEADYIYIKLAEKLKKKEEILKLLDEDKYLGLVSKKKLDALKIKLNSNFQNIYISELLRINED